MFSLVTYSDQMFYVKVRSKVFRTVLETLCEINDEEIEIKPPKQTFSSSSVSKVVNCCFVL